MLILYRIVLYALLPLIMLKLMFRSLKAPAYRQRVKERFGLININPKPGGVWVHAVSVGESIAAIKLVKALQKKYPEIAITLTCGTPTGSAVIRQQLGDTVHHVYAPYDLPGSVKRFLARTRPAVGIVMETEIWPNLLHYASKSRIWLLLSNMRLSETSCRRYRKFPGLIAQSLQSIDQIAAQTTTDAERALSLGAAPESVSVVGNLKFELAGIDPDAAATTRALRDQFACGRAVWIAGSTHEGEDKPVLAVHETLLAKDPALLLIIAPRHPERFDSVYQLCQERFKVQKRSDLSNGKLIDSGTQVLLLNSIGELDQFMQICDWAFIGGSLMPVGGHNILEASQAGIPVLFGPYMDNFKQVAQIVEEQGAGIRVAGQAALLDVCEDLLKDAPKRAQMGLLGQKLVVDNQGALEKTLALLAGALNKS